MQIYELTQPKKPRLDEANPLAAVTGAVGSGVGALKRAGTAIAAPFKDAGSAYSGGQISAKTNSLADKAFRAWSQYANQRMASMDDTEKQEYVSGADGNMKKDLTAFVQKNMLGNQPFDQLNVGNDILKVINQIAPAATPAATATGTATPAATPAATATGTATPAATGTATPAATGTATPATPAQIRANKQKTAAAAAQAQMATPGLTPPVPGSAPAATNPVGFNAANVMKLPGMEKYAKPSAPAKTANFAGPGGYGKTTTSFKPPTASAPSATAPNSPKSVTKGPTTPDEMAKAQAKWNAAAAAQQPETMTEAVKYQPTSQSKALFLKLAQLAASAQRSADTPAATGQTQQPGGTSPIATALGQAGVNTNQLSALGSAIAPNAKLSTTGNPAVDALLKNMGFTVQ
jgi:hypothetical protein